MNAEERVEVVEPEQEKREKKVPEGGGVRGGKGMREVRTDEGRGGRRE